MLKDQLAPTFKNLFGRDAQVFAQAPGRIEFVGNHTDYNGGFVMGVAIDKSICCAVAKRADRKACFANARNGQIISADIDNIQKFPRENNWANYPLGVLKFMIEAGFKPECGFDMTDISNLPSGAGLSSSAAIEMAACAALAKLFGFDIDKKTMAQIGRKSENHFVGMPCGILDQGVSAFGEKDRAVFIDCLCDEFDTLPLPQNSKFYIFNSTKKHALVDGQYAARHAECMEAAKILSEGGEPRLLRAFTLADLEAKKGAMSENAYKRAKHVINENERVLAARECMLNDNPVKLGQILFASHESSRTLFENSAQELDVLVDTLKNTPYVYGARLSGGGFGGAVMALVSSDFSEYNAHFVAEKYKTLFGQSPKYFECRADNGARIV